MGQGSYGYRISLSPAFVHVVPLTFLVWKLFSLPLVVLQEELLYVFVGGSKFRVFLFYHLGPFFCNKLFLSYCF